MLSIKSVIASLLLSLPIALAADPPCDPTNPLTPDSICAVRASFGGGVVPQIIPSFQPSGLLMVTYGTVTLGGAQNMSPSRVATAPVVAISQVPGTKMGPSYTLVMFDGTTKDLTWLQTDLTAQPSTQNLVSNTAPLVPYNSPNPAPNSGLHNYVFLLYTQSGTVTPPTSMSGFDINDFVSKNFPGTTTPAAGMFFRSQYDGVAFTAQTGDITPAVATTVTSTSSSTSISSNKVTTSTHTSSTKLVKVTSSSTGSSGASNPTDTPSGSGNGGSQINGAGKNFGYSGFVLVGVLSLFSSLML